MPPLFVDADLLRSRVSFEAAIRVLEETFAAPSLPDAPQRTVMQRETSQFLLMPAWDAGGAGVKLITVNPGNLKRSLPLIQGLYVLFEGDTLEPVAVFEAASLTALRTAAVSAVATKHLAAPAATRLVVFGSGVQADAHVRALAAVRSLTDVAIVGRDPSSQERLASELSEAGFPARVGTLSDLPSADLVCTCTTSPEPLFDGAALRSGAHVNAVGAHTPQAREVDSATVQRAYVVVETRSAALAEAGDLLMPLGRGEVGADRVPAADLAEVVKGTAPDRAQADISLFKSVGVGFEDLAVARFAYERIRTEQAQKR